MLKHLTLSAAPHNLILPQPFVILGQHLCLAGAVSRDYNRLTSILSQCLLAQCVPFYDRDEIIYRAVRMPRAIFLFNTYVMLGVMRNSLQQKKTTFKKNFN